MLKITNGPVINVQVEKKAGYKGECINWFQFQTKCVFVCLCMCVCVLYLCIEKTWKFMHRILIVIISEGRPLLSIYVVWKFYNWYVLYL